MKKKFESINLSHRQENIIQVLKDFNSATGKVDSQIILNTGNRGEGIYSNKKYEIIKKNKTPISKAKRNPYNNWQLIKEHVFYALVECLYDHNCLSIYDDRLLYQSDNALFHATHHFLEIKDTPTLDLLSGTYRTFAISSLDKHDIDVDSTPETNENDYIVMIGRLKIKHEKKGNYYSTSSEWIHKYNNTNITCKFKGIITKHGAGNKFLIQEKQKKGDYSLYHNIILIPNISPENDFIVIEGLAQLIEHTNTFTRAILMDSNYLDSEISTVLISDNDDKKFPKRYKDILLKHKIRAFKNVIV